MKYGLGDYDKEQHKLGTKKGSRNRVGLLAQDVLDNIIKHYGSDNYANIVNDNLYNKREKGEDLTNVESKLTLAYENLIPFLIKAIQEQQNEINKLKEKVGD
jgi:hypothetical protein